MTSVLLINRDLAIHNVVAMLIQSRLIIFHSWRPSLLCTRKKLQIMGIIHYFYRMKRIAFNLYTCGCLRR